MGVTLSRYGNCRRTCPPNIFAGHSKSQTYCVSEQKTARKYTPHLEKLLKMYLCRNEKKPPFKQGLI